MYLDTLFSKLQDHETKLNLLTESGESDKKKKYCT